MILGLKYFLLFCMCYCYCVPGCRSLVVVKVVVHDPSELWLLNSCAAGAGAASTTGRCRRDHSGRYSVDCVYSDKTKGFQSANILGIRHRAGASLKYLK